MVWFFLNLLILAGIFGLMFGLNIRFDQTSLFGGMTNRMEAVSRLIESDVDEKNRDDRDDILDRFSRAYHVDFYLFDHQGNQLGGVPVTLPDEVYQDITRYEPFGPGPRQSPSDPANTRQSGDLPPPGPPRAVSITTQDPTTYWQILRILTFNENQTEPIRTRLIVRSDSFYGHGLFFDPRPWLAGGLIIVIVSILFWLPLIRGITRSITEMTGAAERIADEDFSIRVDDDRTDELGSLGSSINHLASRLDGFVNGQKRFLGDISHELNSPLARMQFALSILEENARPEEKHHIEDVREEVELMSKLVSELLSYSKAGIQSSAVRLESVDLQRVVEDVVSRERNADSPEIDVNMEPGLSVEAQPELLYRAVANLVRNSLAHTNGNGAIGIDAARNGGNIILTVSDNGPGVPDDMLDKIFDPLFRVQGDRARESGGTGLGLAIVRTCVETCGGKVTARKREPHGLEVEMRLRPANGHPS
jgi:two-component system sensor histidine kinase CpxA